MRFSVIEDVKQAASIRTADYPKAAAQLVKPFYLDCVEVTKRMERSGHGDVVLGGDPFYWLHAVVVFLLFADNGFDEAEYEAYCAFCNGCGYNPFKAKDCAKLANQFTEDPASTKALIAQALAFCQLVRSVEKNETPYHGFLMGLWCLAFANDQLRGIEYDIVACFYDEGHDDVPSSFDEVKAALQ